jgi:hypothetical protein
VIPGVGLWQRPRRPCCSARRPAPYFRSFAAASAIGGVACGRGSGSGYSRGRGAEHAPRLVRLDSEPTRQEWRRPAPSSPSGQSRRRHVPPGCTCRSKGEPPRRALGAERLWKRRWWLRRGIDPGPLRELPSVLDLEPDSLDPDDLHDRPILKWEGPQPSTRAPADALSFHAKQVTAVSHGPVCGNVTRADT